MNSSARSATRTLWVAIRVMIAATVVLGVAYPLVVTGIGRWTLPTQAGGSIVRATDGRAVGSTLIGQSFTDSRGRPIARYFQPRPSAAGNGYDAGSSGGSNLGPNSARLAAQMTARRAQVARFNGVSTSAVPSDAVTSSGSGLDPDISLAYARIQVDRVARARRLSAGRVAAVVDRYTRGGLLGFAGPPRVDVLKVNLALDREEG